jgi:hypothetical protein
VEPTTRFRPADGGVDFRVEALDQFASNGGALVGRQTQRLEKNIS